jgi:hypothetical protein
MCMQMQFHEVRFELMRVGYLRRSTQVPYSVAIRCDLRGNAFDLYLLGPQFVYRLDTDYLIRFS